MKTHNQAENYRATERGEMRLDRNRDIKVLLADTTGFQILKGVKTVILNIKEY